MAPSKTGTKSSTPTGSASPGKQSVASNFSEVDLPEVPYDKSRAPSQISDDFNDSPGPSKSKKGKATPDGEGTPGGGSPGLGSLRGTPASSRRGESSMSKGSGGRSSVFGVSPASQFWRGLGYVFCYYGNLYVILYHYVILYTRLWTN